jgi:molybdenum cofactor cytidylyltransferase
MQLKKHIMKSFRESGKRHLLITGSKNYGKTSIFNEILKNEESIGGIITEAIGDDKIVPKYVTLRDMNDSNLNSIIAIRNNSGTSLIPVTDTFENLGTDILRKYNNGSVKLIAIDEIGFLENNAVLYQAEIFKSFEKKVIAIIRKVPTLFTKKLTQRQDVYFIDIDKV